MEENMTYESSDLQITLDGYQAEYYEYPNNTVLIIEKVKNLEILQPKTLVVSKKQFDRIVNKNGNFKTI